jgi:hypothetical protein
MKKINIKELILRKNNAWNVLFSLILLTFVILFASFLYDCSKYFYYNTEIKPEKVNWFILKDKLDNFKIGNKYSYKILDKTYKNEHIFKKVFINIYLAKDFLKEQKFTQKNIFINKNNPKYSVFYKRIDISLGIRTLISLLLFGYFLFLKKYSNRFIGFN